MDTLPFSAVVLAGGASRRMGQDKALISLGEQTVLERILGVLHEVSSDVKIIGGRKDYRRFKVPIVDDDDPGQGPLGGIATALANARYETTFVVACDMPLIRSDVIRYLAGYARTFDALVVRRPGETGFRLEPMHAMYATNALPAIRAEIQAGNLRVESVFNHLNVRVVEADKLREIDPDLQSFTNMNTPQDVEMVKAILEGI